MMMVILQYIVGIVLVAGSYGLIPYLTPDTIQFGVRIPPAHLSSPSISRVRKTYYRYWIAISVVSVLAGTAAFMPASGTNMTTPIVVLVVMLLLHYLNYLMARRQLLKAKQTERWYEGVAQGLVADTQSHTKQRGPSLLWSMPASLVTIASITIAAVRYNKLPQRIAIHFDVTGAANGFAAKSFWSVFGPCLMELIFVLILLVVHVRLHQFSVRLDPANPSASRHRVEAFRRAGLKATWVMLAMINLGMTVSLLPLWGLFSSSVAGVASLGSVMTILGVVVGIIWIARTAQTTRQIGASSQGAHVVARDDDRYWILGAFYFNRSDPALFIPKRFGIGITVNMAHPGAWLSLLVIIAIPVAISIAASLAH